ncbi:hypothetical protein PHMEG_00022601 [Phytophthora megakarya]|uniref:Uncharacterized protein n=1 Tax=Phytophthora megakarya TaxID=4795 RepID=A0A225VKC2_9STRA|nr:hypothetical protein PHMEG_00022601 [Phytophthora megakarya]
MLTQASKLRLKTSLRQRLRQETRWGSSFAMLARYFELREHISADDEDLTEFMLSPAANWRLQAWLVELAEVESMSMKLPSEDLNLLYTRDLLDGLLEIKPSLRHYLSPSTDIVVALGRANKLSWAEKATLKPFESEASAAAAAIEETTKVGFADRILKRRKVQDNLSAYMQLNAIPRPEKLFSMARMVLRYERDRLAPLMLEMMLFIKVNSKHWDVTTVDAVI